MFIQNFKINMMRVLYLRRGVFLISPLPSLTSSLATPSATAGTTVKLHFSSHNLGNQCLLAMEHKCLFLSRHYLSFTEESPGEFFKMQTSEL